MTGPRASTSTSTSSPRTAVAVWPGAIATMDRRSIATGVLSYPAPLAAPDDPAGARAGAGRVNEYTA